MKNHPVITSNIKTLSAKGWPRKPKDRTRVASSGTYLIDVVGLSAILKGKQKLGVTFNSDKLGGIDFTKFSKLTMCSA